MSSRKVDSRTVKVSNEDKVFFPDAGITKGQLVDYHHRIAERMLPFLEDRPLVMRRFPDGIDSGGFFQKDVPNHFPDWIERVRLEKKEGGTLAHAVADNPATLVYLADQGTIEIHTLLAPASSPHHPDQMILDLDPSTDDPSDVVAAARAVEGVLDDIGVSGFVKTTGSRGVHVLVGLDCNADFDAARDVARTLADTVVERDPDRLTTRQSKKDRGHRVFIDWLRNSYGQHAVAPYSVRALPGAPVAVPLDWKEATSQDFDPQKYTIKNVFRRLTHKDDPWTGLYRHVYSVDSLADRLQNHND